MLISQLLFPTDLPISHLSPPRSCTVGCSWFGCAVYFSPTDLYLSHFLTPCSCMSGGLSFDPSSTKLLQPNQSSASILFRSSNKLSELIVSHYLFLGRPRGLFPFMWILHTLMSSSLSRQRTCPYHSILFRLIRSFASITLASLAISSLVLCSSRLIHRLYLFIISHEVILFAESPCRPCPIPIE